MSHEKAKEQTKDKKEPTKSLKEKRAAKKAKKEEKKRLYAFVFIPAECHHLY